MNVSEHIRHHLYERFIPTPMPPLERLRATEWDDEYEILRRNRMVMGAFRYGPIQRQSLEQYDLPNECIHRVQLYQQDHNLEHLVDAGNMAMLAFVNGRRNKHPFNSTDDGTHATRRI